MVIKNLQVYGLDESSVRSGFPQRTGEPKESISVKDYSKNIERLIRLGKMSGGHDNCLKGVIVQFDILINHAMMVQAQRYNWWDIVSSQSKTHSITKLKSIKANCNSLVKPEIIEIVDGMIKDYNNAELKASAAQLEEYKRFVFNAIIANVPLGFELWQGITTNYLQLKNIYKQRKNHKLYDWRQFCDFVEGLPFMKEILE